jgi:hypothetical protein
VVRAAVVVQGEVALVVDPHLHLRLLLQVLRALQGLLLREQGVLLW